MAQSADPSRQIPPTFGPTTRSSACPSWCVTKHEGADGRDVTCDGVDATQHWAEGVRLPVAAGARDQFATPEELAEGHVVDVYRVQGVGRAEAVCLSVDELEGVWLSPLEVLELCAALSSAAATLLAESRRPRIGDAA